jgi:hypothetical protein
MGLHAHYRSEREWNESTISQLIAAKSLAFAFPPFFSFYLPGIWVPHSNAVFPPFCIHFLEPVAETQTCWINPHNRLKWTVGSYAMARLVSVKVLDKEIEEFQRLLKRKRRISQSSDDETLAESPLSPVHSSTSCPSNFTEASLIAFFRPMEASASEKQSDKGRHSGRVWGAELPSPTKRSPVKRLVIPPIPPERFYAADPKAAPCEDSWQHKLEILRQPVGYLSSHLTRVGDWSDLTRLPS